jgi:Rieske Fe-S protein
MTTAHSSHELSPGQTPPQRRNFLVEFAALAAGAVATLIPGIAAMAFFLNPLLKKKTTAGTGDGFIMVGTTRGLKPGGDPQFFQVVGIKKDAWTTYPATSLGAVYVRQQEDGKLLCLNARCTHLGCTVKFRPELHEYLCPCHASSFNLEGGRANQIPPRDMDELQAEIRNQDQIWVRFQNFRGGRHEKVPV